MLGTFIYALSKSGNRLQHSWGKRQWVVTTNQQAAVMFSDYCLVAFWLPRSVLSVLTIRDRHACTHRRLCLLAKGSNADSPASVSLKNEAVESVCSVASEALGREAVPPSVTRPREGCLRGLCQDAGLSRPLFCLGCYAGLPRSLQWGQEKGWGGEP